MLPTTADTESQFEAQLRQAILQAFPWLPAKSISHQNSFSFKFGHATVTVDGRPRGKASARSDVLVRFKDQALAIFELKRPGTKLTAEDNAQGLSYARVLHPRPPLVVVSNGSAFKILDTQTGELWQPATKSETALSGLLATTVQVAQSDLKRAVDTLMGSNPDLWVQAIRQVTSNSISELSGNWGEPLVPFVDGFLIPRRVTREVLQTFQTEKRLVIVQGPPLSGKSNVLREVAKLTVDHPLVAVLYLNADNGLRIFDEISLILSNELDWPVTAAEARQWLINLSRAGGPVLALAIDNIVPDGNELRQDLQTLTSNLFGPAVRCIIAVDDAVAEQLTLSAARRSASPLALRSISLSVEPLDDDEFEHAEAVLGTKRLTFVSGASHSPELRKPWVIRALMSGAITAPEYNDTNLIASLSPVPGLEILELAGQRFDISQPPFSRYRELAQALLVDAQDADRPYQLKLELLNSFIVRRSVARALIDPTDLAEMLSFGLIRESRSFSEESIYTVRLPELMANELSKLISDELITRAAEDPRQAGDWLTGAASNLPLGDVIAADALLNAAVRNRGLDIRVVTELRLRTPKKTKLSPGSVVSGYIEGLGVVDMISGDDGSFLLRHPNGEEVMAADEDDEPFVTYEDMHPYQILAQMAGYPIEVLGAKEDLRLRLDPDLLIAVGSVPIIMRNSAAISSLDGVLSHNFGDDISVVCHKAGIVEPITWSLVRFFGREPEESFSQLLEMILEDPHPALLARVDMALRETARSHDAKRAKWAVEAMNAHIRPALSDTLSGYLHA